MKSASLPKLQNSSRSAKSSRANKDIGIRRKISPLRDSHVEERGTGMKNVNRKPKFPPGAPSARPPESGNRYGK